MSEDRAQQLPDDGVRLILARLDSMDGRFDRMETRFDSMETRLDSMDARLTALEEKVERRLHDTRPIWEQVLSRLTNIETRLTDIETRLTNIETRLTAVESRLDKVEKRLEKVEGEVYSLKRRMRVFTDDILKIQDTQEEFDERLRQVESGPTPE